MENKNFIIAIILSVVIMFVWTEFFAPKPQQVDKTDGQEKETVVEEKVPAPLEEIIQPAEKTAESINSDELKVSVVHPEKTGSITNGYLTLEYSTLSGKVTSSKIVAKKYASKEVDLADAMAAGAYFPNLNSVFGNEPGYKVKRAGKDFVEFTYENKGITESKTIKLLDNYRIEISKKVANNTEYAIPWKPSLNFSSQQENESILSSYRRKFEVVMGKMGGEYESCGDQKDVDSFLSTGNRVNWAGINYGYFLFAVLSKEKDLEIEAEINKSKNLSRFSVSEENRLLQPGDEREAVFSIFYGTKERELLVKEDLGLEKTISFGWTSFLSEPLLIALNFFYKYVGNYGIAIILLTIVVKLLLFPLSNASYKSMNRMKKLQPKIKLLQEKHKNDKETLNKETMLLYQKEGVNPLGGCLPMFIQMPVYISLYYMIQNATELYNAPFLPVWLTDLSEKDPYYIIPVSLGILMFVQTKLTPQQTDNKQAKIMMYTMPVVFTWISLVLPAGMTLYWFVNTLLGIAQQFYITKKYQ
jgi:YidC/Oxa1 family membrane protein insertase